MLLLNLGFALVSSTLAATTCKVLPGDPKFPSPSVLSAFSKTLTKPLVAQRPLGAVCKTKDPLFNSSACAFVTEFQGNGHMLAAWANTVQGPSGGEIVTQNSTQQCLLEEPSTPCLQGRVPNYTVNATNVQDIINTVKFASKYNLHLVVKNTGHDVFGRGFGVGALEIFTHDMQGTNFTDNFVPAHAPKGTKPQTAVTIAPGVQWGPLYDAAGKAGRTVAGGIGAGGTVGAGGGWPAGTGHSVLSPFFGLGVDNVLQFDIVLPNATHLTHVTQYTNPDLFWAVRGGGGPSFGIITSLTYRTHPNPAFTAGFFVGQGDSASSYEALMALWVKHHNVIADAGWAGFWPYQQNTLFLTLIAQGTPPTSANANSTLQAFYDEASKLQGVNVTLANSVNYTDFADWYDNNFINSQNGFGFNYSIGDTVVRPLTSSWIMPRDLFNATNTTSLVNALVGIPAARPFLVGGGAVAAINPDTSAAVPAWRTCISDMTVDAGYGANATFAEIQALKETVTGWIQPLRDLAPPPMGGQYLNEGDMLEKNWQAASWGSHYPRLLAIKKAVDPKDLFIVQHGVNSEGWNTECTCKTV